MPKLQLLDGGKSKAVETQLTISVSNDTKKLIDQYILDRVSVILSSIVAQVNLANSNEIMSRDDAKAFFKDISDVTLNKYVEAGLPKHKKGNIVLYLREECLNFVASWPAE